MPDRHRLSELYSSVRIFTLILIFTLSLSHRLIGQEVVAVRDHMPHHIISYGEIDYLEDKSNVLTLEDVLKPSIASKFKPNRNYTPKNYNLSSAYWYRFKIKHNSLSRKNWILEFFDQSIHNISLYVPDSLGKYSTFYFGTAYPFGERQYQHKNFTFDLNNDTDKELTYYVRLKSSQSVGAIIVLRDVHWFIKYALNEYLIFGLFYGMVIVFSLYNLLMFFAIKQRQYLYYVLYNLSIGLYEMSSDGIAFQYLWPNQPWWNEYGFGFALFFSSIFGLLFTLNFLYVKSKAPKLYRLIIGMIILRSLFFILCLFNKNLFSYKLIELVPLLLAWGTGIYIFRNRYRPARFFVMGYSFLLLGFVIKILLLLNIRWLPYGPFTYYSLSFCFVIEMILVSFAIGDSVRTLRRKKDKAQKRIIDQLQINEKLKDTLNRELSSLVDERTRELVDKASIIEKQNEEISMMNAMLEKDNQELHTNIEKVTRARVMSHEVDFAEFSKIYPDRETCFKYLSELKWSKGYACRKCSNEQYLTGYLPYSRRCTKCGYDESVIAYTLFQNSRIPINKAFYMLFLVYSTKGKISSHKLSELLLIRQSTCWSYNSKMQKVLEERKKELKNAGDGGWSKLVLESN
ncbi:chromosome partitioning protein ParA [Pedobacter sp. HMWF019]|uniref:7TMR-DISM family protein n=1 Tax=Pedobacter sp. HMWF019 TaxID=2056856 RepID=UPI000D3AC5DE|nr:7TM diverse intracellular signaling domain-containing protein [Pedobacter sp. HMWF019]PTS92324.1 chromosome partitioning protein ParA [Pedobacter sp. HMWF019]